LDSALGAMGYDLVSATLNAAGVDEDTAEALPLRVSSTRGSTMQDVISPLAVAIAQADEQLDDLRELDVPSMAVSVLTAQDQDPNLKSTLTLFLSSFCNLSNIQQEIKWLRSDIAQVRKTMMSLASQVHADINDIKGEVDAIRGETDATKAEIDWVKSQMVQFLPLINMGVDVCTTFEQDKKVYVSAMEDLLAGELYTLTKINSIVNNLQQQIHDLCNEHRTLL
jgi:hypothetical protein